MPEPRPGREPRIGIDYWPATTHAPGVGRYVRELVRALVQLETPPKLRLFDVGPGPRTLGEEALGLPADGRCRRVTAAVPRRAVAALAWAADARRLLGGCDLFHRVFPDQPVVKRGPQVLALSEVPRARGAAEERLLPQLRSGGGPIDDVIVMSAHARELARERLDLPPDRVHFVPVGCDHWVRDVAPLEHAPERASLLVLGATDGRRRHALIVTAFGRLRARGLDCTLVFSGRRGEAAGEVAATISSSPFRDDITWHDDPREADLPALMARASVLVHLSDDEHTPVTPLEACASGTAVVASSLPAFAEALGDVAELVPADTDADQLCEALERGLESAWAPGPRGRRLELARAYTWEGCARATQTVWKRILAR